jgi:hypothetical protein
MECALHEGGDDAFHPLGQATGKRMIESEHELDLRRLIANGGGW